LNLRYYAEVIDTASPGQPSGSNLQNSADAGVAWHAAVKRRRRSLGLTQRDVAGLAGVAERTVIAVEQGRTGVSLGHLVRVLEVLGLGLSVRRGRGITADGV
jgi:HTH-type transcriptional regulator / antitoxin HipB